MNPTIRVDDEVIAKLKEVGEPFVDTPNSVLRKILKLEDSEETATEQELEVEKKSPAGGTVEEAPITPGSITTYSHPRLCFKASYIEPLNDDDVFEVETAKDGTFRFTKAEFYRVFPNVIRSVSYKEDGIYHYPKVPKKKALPFKIK